MAKEFHYSLLGFGACSIIMSAQAHEEGEVSLLKVETVHEFPRMYFVENLAVRSNGGILVTVHNRNELIHVDPTQGQRTLVHTFENGVSGIAEIEPDVFYISVGEIGNAGSYGIFTVDMTGFAPDREAATVRKLVNVPDALFLNGSVVPFPGRDIILLADSIIG